MSRAAPTSTLFPYTTLFRSELRLPDLDQGQRGPVVIALGVQRCTPAVVDRLKEVLRTHPGATEVHLHLQDRKSTRLNSSHSQISYAVFCLKKKHNIPGPFPL